MILSFSHVYLAVAAGLVVAASSCAAGTAVPRPAPPSPAGDTTLSTFCLMNIEKDGLSIEVRLNDVPVEVFQSDGPGSTGATVNMWVTPGMNRLRVRAIRPLPEKSPVGSVKVGIRTLQRGQAPSEAQVLVTLEWPRPDSTPALDETRQFLVEETPPSALWSRASTILLDGLTRAPTQRTAPRSGAIDSRRNPNSRWFASLR